MVPQVNQTHDIVLDGVGYICLPNTLIVARATPFTTRIGTGRPTHSDLDNWDVLSQCDWSHGLGQEGGGDAELDPAMYYEGDGVETSLPGLVQLGTQVVTSDPGVTMNVFCDGGGKYLFAGGINAIRYYDEQSDTWAQAKGIANSEVLDMIEYKGAVYATYGLARDMQRCPDPANAPTTWEAVGSAVTGRNYLAVWKDKLWTSRGASLYSFDGSSWGSEVICGDTDSIITNLTPTADFVIVGKEDRIMLFDGTDVHESGLLVPRFVGNFKRGRIYDGAYWYPQLGTIRSVTGLGSAAAITDRTPKWFGNDSRLLYGYGLPCALAANANRLFVLFTGTEGYGTHNVVLKWNGLGWHPVYAGVTAAGNAIYYSQVTDRLWINDGATRYQKYLTNGNPYPDYRADGAFITSLDSAGFDEIDKAWRSVTVVAENVTAQRYLTLQYQTRDEIDSDTWHSMPNITTNGTTEVLFSASGAAIGAKCVRLKVGFTRASGAGTPRIKVLTVKRILRPKTLFVITAQVQLADNLHLLDGSRDTASGQQLAASLVTTSDKVTPVTLDTPDGYRHKGVLTNLSFHETEKREAV